MKFNWGMFVVLLFLICWFCLCMICYYKKTMMINNTPNIERQLSNDGKALAKAVS